MVMLMTTLLSHALCICGMYLIEILVLSEIFMSQIKSLGWKIFKR